MKIMFAPALKRMENNLHRDKYPQLLDNRSFKRVKLSATLYYLNVWLEN